MLNTEWQLSGSMADRYERYLVPVVFLPWATDLLSRSRLGPGDRLLDLACGTGIVARTAAARGILATGGDINAGMLAMARQCAAGLEVAFEQADAQALPFADACFDAVICQQGFQFFPDRRAALGECHRVLKPGGQAIFCTARALEENPMMQAQVTAFAAVLGEAAAAPIRAVCGFDDAGATRALFAEAGFAPVAVESVALALFARDGRAFVDGLMKSTPVADRIAEMGPAARQDLQDRILAAFGDCFDGRALRFPHSANVVVAERAG